MRKIPALLATLLLAIPTFAQVDIVSPWRGPFGDLGRNLTWGVSGAGGMNNAFVINVPSPQQGACLFIRNLSTFAAHSFTLRVFITADQQALGYYATPGAVWEPVNVVSQTWTQGVNSYFVPTSLAGAGLAVFSVSPASGAKVAFVISGSTNAGANDTANIFYTFGSPSPCSAYIPPNAQIFVDSRSLVAASLPINWIGFASGSLFPGAPQTWRACSFYLNATLTGAAGTLNTYIASWDSFTQTQDDRVSFVQLAATGKQAAQVNFENPAVPHAVLVNALAAGSLVTGVLSDTMRLTYVVAGAGCTYNVGLIAICH